MSPSNAPTPIPPPPIDPPEKPKRKRVPVRWLTLAEAVGLLALVIAGLGYWDTHRERADQEKERQVAAKEHQAEKVEGALKQAFAMTGTADATGDIIRLSAVHGEQVIQTQTLYFPVTVKATSVETTGNPRIEARWVEDGLRRTAGDDRRGRLPVGVQTVYLEDGQLKTDRSVYLIGYSLHRHLLGDKVQLEGLSLARRGISADLQGAAGAIWASRQKDQDPG